MFQFMKATTFDTDAPPYQRRIIVRYGDEGVEMVELPWGLRPKKPGNLPFMRAEGRKFPSHRCLVPASEFLISRHGQRYRFSLADGDWFYFAGIWRPASEGWPGAYAILTIEANADVAPFQARQMAVLRRRQRMDWLDLSRPEHELLQPLPVGAFRIERTITRQTQTVLALWSDALSS